jgi:hypothetical protein
MRRILHCAALVVIVSLASTSGAAEMISFPSLLSNGDFEDWVNVNEPEKWLVRGWAGATQADPFLGKYAAMVHNGQPWEGGVYQEVRHPGYPLMFGCVHYAELDWGNEIILIFKDAFREEISRKSWTSAPGTWHKIHSLVRPPQGTVFIEVYLQPAIDGISVMWVDHVFLIPLP